MIRTRWFVVGIHRIWTPHLLDYVPTFIIRIKRPLHLEWRVRLRESAWNETK